MLIVARAMQEGLSILQALLLAADVKPAGRIVIGTAQGNIVGNPVLPVIKISGNPLTVETMSEHIDVDVIITSFIDFISMVYNICKNSNFH